MECIFNESGVRGCQHYESETKGMYGRPNVKKPPNTRERTYRNFFFQEFYEEYKKGDPVEVTETPKTIYYTDFCENVPGPVELRKDEIKYPLYTSAPITCYNPTGDSKVDFKRRYVITRPMQEQKEQFG